MKGGGSFTKMMGAVVFYMSSSMAMTIYNKWLLRDFRYPIIMLISSSIICLMFTHIMLRVFYREVLLSDEWFPRYGWSRLFTEMCPIALLFTLDTCATNASLESISISLVEILKTKSIIVIVLVQFCTGREEAKCSTFMIMLFVTAGACLTVLGDTTATVTGVLWVEVANLASLFRMLLMEMLLNDKQFNPYVYLAYTMPFVIIALLPVFFILEYRPMMQTPQMQKGEIWHTLVILGAGGVLAFCINLSMAMTMSHVSLITFQVVGVVKLLILMGLSMYIFGYQLNKYNEAGIVVSIISVSIFKYTKYVGLSQSSQPKNVDSVDDDDDDGGGDDEESVIRQITSVVGENSHQDRVFASDVLPSLNFDGDDDDDDDNSVGSSTPNKSAVPFNEESPKKHAAFENDGMSNFDMEVQALLAHVDDDSLDDVQFDSRWNR